jgi:hypothetical protein
VAYCGIEDSGIAETPKVSFLIVFTHFGTSTFCFIVRSCSVVLVETLNQNTALLSNFTMHVRCTLAQQPCPAALPGSHARQPCPAALPGSLARQPCPAALMYYKLK